MKLLCKLFGHIWLEVAGKELMGSHSTIKLYWCKRSCEVSQIMTINPQGNNYGTVYNHIISKDNFFKRGYIN